MSGAMQFPPGRHTPSHTLYCPVHSTLFLLALATKANFTEISCVFLAFSRMEVDTSPSPTVKPGLTRLPSQDLEPTSSYFARLVSTSSPTLTTHQAAPESQGLIPSIFDPSTSLGPRSSPSTINSSAGSNSLDASRRGRPPQAASIGFGPSSPSRGSQPGLVLRILGPTVAWASG